MEQRAYIRDDDSWSRAKISRDNKTWQETRVYDLSAGGLKFFAEGDFEIGNVLWFDLSVHDFLFKSEVLVQGVICREECDANGHIITYGVAFKTLTTELRIRIDEMILYKKRFFKEKLY